MRKCCRAQVNRSLPIPDFLGNRGLRAKASSVASAATGLLAFSLAACQTPATRTETVQVKVPVATTPLKPAQVPTPPAPLGPRPSSLSAAADVLLADHCSWVAFGLKAFPLLRVSAGLPPSELPKYPECEGR